MPISYIFQPGHRMRVRVQFADSAGEITGAGHVELLHGPDRPTRVTLPVIPS